MTGQDKTLYERLGGYDAIAAVASNLLPRLENDAQLGRFWENRGDDGIAREKQLLIDYQCRWADAVYRPRHANLTQGHGYHRK